MLKDKVANKIKEFLANDSKFSDLDFSKLSLSIPRNPEHGDYSTNFALVSSGKLKTRPMDLARDILEIINQNKDPFFDNISVEEPGFINFKISNNVYQEYLKDMECHKIQ